MRLKHWSWILLQWFAVSVAMAGPPATEADAAMGQGKAGTTFRECAHCPVMVIVPRGRFSMGSPDSEAGRGTDETPVHPVRIDYTLAIGAYEITLAQYRDFTAATKRVVGGDCITDRMKAGDWKPHAETTFVDPGFTQEADHPVACVSWEDAHAYIDWINAQTGGGYRLPTEAEWEYVARAGSRSAYPWGESADDGCRDANNADANFAEKYPDAISARCDDGALNTAPVGRYRPNAFGLYDVIGNVNEWTLDCAAPDYLGAPIDGSAQLSAGCDRRITRGGSWGTSAKDTRAANRMRYSAGARDDSIGFRLARTVTNSSP